jgi:hypothetical protein
MANVTLTFAYAFPSTFGGEPVMQYNFINPVTFEAVHPSIAKTFAQICLSCGYPELKEFAAALYNSSDATVVVGSSLIPKITEVAGVFQLEGWKYDILLGIINGAV